MLHHVDFQHLDYVILPGPWSCDESVHTYQQLIFRFWEQSWNEVYQNLGSHERTSPGEFTKQSAITAILSGVEVVALHFLRVIDVTTSEEMDRYSPCFRNTLLKNGVRTAQTLQYYFVNSKWSPRLTGHNFSAIIAGLSFRNQTEFGVDASITLARRDLPAVSVALKFGMHIAGSALQMHNVPVAQLYACSTHPYPRADVNNAINILWNRRVEKINRSFWGGVKTNEHSA